MKTNQDMLILGIETSCDETSVAVVKGGTEVLSNVISSQMDLHRPFGGVVPELASRHHVERITLVIQLALEEANVSLDEIDLIAVTRGPGLVGALLIGVIAAKSLSLAKGIPLVGVHHIAGHIYAGHLVSPLEFPLLALVVSGGHTELIYMQQHHHFKILGHTRDDAVGESFDKVARLLKLPYPGGPQIEELAKKGTATYDLPRAWLSPDSLDFSFSGLKTAVRNYIQQAEQRGEEVDCPSLAASFQEAALDVLVEKSMRAVKKTGVKRLLLGGGVSANGKLRQRLLERCQEEQVQLIVPPLELCTDNAAMIAVAGMFQWIHSQERDSTFGVNPNLPLTK